MVHASCDSVVRAGSFFVANFDPSHAWPASIPGLGAGPIVAGVATNSSSCIVTSADGVVKRADLGVTLFRLQPDNSGTSRPVESARTGSPTYALTFSRRDGISRYAVSASGSSTMRSVPMSLTGPRGPSFDTGPTGGRSGFDSFPSAEVSVGSSACVYGGTVTGGSSWWVLSSGKMRYWNANATMPMMSRTLPVQRRAFARLALIMVRVLNDSADQALAPDDLLRSPPGLAISSRR